MPEIGATLREARMRARIDITEVEQATKIRAKYLRAIENEEWDLLPGSTFVKSFIREYADFLGLDARTLVEEYKLRYERPSEHELRPISPNLGRDRRGGGFGGGGRGFPRWALVALVLVAIVGVLFAVGSLFGDDEPDEPEQAQTTTVREQTTTAQRAPRRQPRRRAAAPRVTRVQLTPTGTIYICLVDQDGRVLVPGLTFEAGAGIEPRRARSMRVTLGNNQVELTVNGRAIPLEASSAAIALELTPRGARPLPEAQAPTCT